MIEGRRTLRLLWFSHSAKRLETKRDDRTDEELEPHVRDPTESVGPEVLADHAYQADRSLYSCDLQMGGMFNVFKKPLFEDHHCFIGRSEEFIKDLKLYPAVVFLDGEHTYKTLRMEVDYFLPRLQTGGVMFIHDTFPHSVRMVKKDGTGTMPEDIYRIRQELERDPDLDVFTWPYTALSCGLTMVMKHVPNKDRDYWRLNGRAEGGNETHK